MAWVTPTTRSTGDLITAAIWNQDVVDNPAHLGGLLMVGTALSAKTAGSELFPLLQFDYGQDGTSRSTSATSYTNVSGTDLSLTTASNRWVIVCFSVDWNVQTAGAGQIQLARTSGSSGTFTTLQTATVAAGSGVVGHALFGRLSAHSVATSHTFYLQMKHSTGAGTVEVTRTHGFCVEA